MAAEGLTNREIAQALFVTEKTVETHLGRAFSKLGVRSRKQLAEALAEVAEYRNLRPPGALQLPVDTHIEMIDVGARVMANQALPEGVAQGTKGLVVGQAGWIQRRWRVRFDDGPTVDAPEYALELCVGRGRFKRG